jgi:uncharacterized membrane protein HdeD (DUF308 family)
MATSDMPASGGAAPQPATEVVHTPWWVGLISGIAMAVIGLLLLSAPALTIVALVQFLGFYWLIDGIVRLASIFVDRSGWIWKLLIGILGILAGITIIQHPIWSAILIPTTVAFYFGFVGLVIGVLEIIMAFKGAGWGTGLLGAVNALLGLVLLFNPLAGAIALPFVLGVLALVGGIGTAIASFAVRSADRAAA